MSRYRFNTVTLPLCLLTAIATALLARAIVSDYVDAEQRALEAATLVAQRGQETLANAIITKDTSALDAWLATSPLPYAVQRVRAYDATGQLIAEVNDRHIEHTALTPMVRWLATMGVFPTSPAEIMRPILDDQNKQVGTTTVDIDLMGEYAHTVQGWVVAGLISSILIAIYLLWSSNYVKRRTRFLSLLSHFAAHMQQGHGLSRLECTVPREFTALADALNDLAGTQEAQEAARRFISNVLESMPDSLIVVNPDSSIRSVNKATLKLLGYTEEELGDRQFSIICSADGQHLTPERLDDFLGSGSRRDTEVVYTSKSGEPIPVALSGSAITDSNNRRTGYVCIATDIRPRKQAEAEQQALHDKFIQTSRQAGMAEVATGVLHNVGNVLNSVNVSATLIADRIHDCEVDRLLQATTLMEQHIDSLPEFLTDDPKGNALPGYLIALSKQIADNQSQLFDEIDALTRNVGHIKSIVSTQQHLSKSSNLIETIAPDRLVEEALEMSGKIADRSHIRLIRKFDRIPDVETDRHRVLQVLVNLINNAVDAMAETVHGKATLTISITNDESNSDTNDNNQNNNENEQQRVCVSIQDTGIGIESDALTKIFTLGFTTKEDGHGYGLHSSSLTAKELGGSLNVKSDGPGTGATFTLQLPTTQSARRDVA